MIKRLLLFLGHDRFDDMEMTVLVHEAIFESSVSKLSTLVRITAGDHCVSTDANTRGIFQQPVHITVEQGTTKLVIDLLDSRDVLLATLLLDIEAICMNANNLQPETIYMITKKGTRIHNPQIKLTMVVNHEDEAERGTLSAGFANFASDVNILVSEQLKKAKRGATSGQETVSELDVLKEACSGPLECFEGLGYSQKVYVAVIGPPISRRWGLGIWSDKDDYLACHPPNQEVDLLKVQSIQADPTRNHVFVLHSYDARRVRYSLTFRRVDRARDVWVEILRLLVTKAREDKAAVRQVRKTGIAKDVAKSSLRSKLGKPSWFRS